MYLHRTKPHLQVYTQRGLCILKPATGRVVAVGDDGVMVYRRGIILQYLVDGIHFRSVEIDEKYGDR